MAKRLEMIDVDKPRTSVSELTETTDWSKCVICQEHIEEKLECPANSSRRDSGAGYKSFSQNVTLFHEMKTLPVPLNLGRLDEGSGIDETLMHNKASWHKSCRCKFNTTKLKRAEKRKVEVTANYVSDQRYTRSKTDTGSGSSICFFCDETLSDDEHREASTLELDSKVRKCALFLEDQSLLAKLSTGDMIAIEAKYHPRCLTELYNRVRGKERKQKSDHRTDDMLNSIALAELVAYIEESRQDAELSPVFKLKDLVSLYTSRLNQLGADIDKRVNSTSLKERILINIPDLQAHTKGREVILVFESDIGHAINRACNQSCDNEAMIMSKAASIVRKELFEMRSSAKEFNGNFSHDCQGSSVPHSLLALVSMIHEGPSIKDQTRQVSSSSALSVSQIIAFNTVKYKRDKATSSTIRHSRTQETPLPIYLGLLLHAHTRKKELIDKLSHLGLSVSYDRVLRISSDLANGVCKRFEDEGAVCPPNLRSNLFTTAAVDNIDHNPSSTTATDSFHGTGISLFQHPDADNTGEDRGTIIYETSSTRKTVDKIPETYTIVPPILLHETQPNVPQQEGNLTGEGTTFTDEMHHEYQWLDFVGETLKEGENEGGAYISWAAFHASRQQKNPVLLSHSSLLPLFKESAHSIAMVRHAMVIIRAAVHKLNPQQIPVVTFDQPLYAIAKQVQWNWQADFGESHCVVMLGGLHIEMAAFKTLGDWLDGSGWTDSLVHAGVASIGTADSFLKAVHITRTRHAHQITAAALHSLQKKAYTQYLETVVGELMNFESWCDERKRDCPQFKYWSLTLELQLLVFMFIRSIRTSDFSLYIESLTMLAPWVFALDHTHYARFLPVHIRDMKGLQAKHPATAKEFSAGKFTVKRSHRVFSAIAIDHAHEQNNAYVKGDGGAVGLTENPDALRRWMLSGPEIARVIGEFELTYLDDDKGDIRHHEQQKSIQVTFSAQVKSIVSSIEELGNPFLEEGKDLISLETKEIADASVIKTVNEIQDLGREQFNLFVKERLVDRTKSLYAVIPRNKLPLFRSIHKKVTVKVKTQLAYAKSDCSLFSRLYIGCQTRDGDLDDFFEHENQAYPPSLSEGGKLRVPSAKSDLIDCLNSIVESTVEQPNTITAMIIDGAAVVNMLKPVGVRTFEQYAMDVFKPYIISRLQSVARLDIVWDMYIENSLKSSTRQKRGKGKRRRVVPSAAIPKNWQDFLREDANKTELFAYLSQCCNGWNTDPNKELVATYGESVLVLPAREDVSSLSPCSHEEADTRIFVHAVDAAVHGHMNILIRTVDTDVLVLAVSIFQTMGIEELWLEFGSGKHRRYISAGAISTALGTKAKALSFFHAFTGCDTVSCFVGHGKLGAWEAWNSFPDVTQVFEELGNVPSQVSEQYLDTLERFVVILYDRTSTCTQVNSARKYLFTKKRRTMERIPPTKEALRQHVLRAAYQAGHVWGQTCVLQPHLPPPEEWGWMKSEDGSFTPFWTTLPQVSESSKELIRCGCLTGCTNRRCKCVRHELLCTELCECGGECTRD